MVAKLLLKNWKHESTTITVGELIAHFQTFDPDLRVAYTWENQVKPVEISGIKIEQETDKVHGPIVMMDADYHG